MSDLIHRAQTAKTIIGETSLAKHERALQALQAFSGLVLSDLDEDASDQLEADLVGVNAIVAQYDLQKGDDYQRVSDVDLQQMLDLIDVAASHVIDTELDRIVAELDAGEKKLPEDAIRETREHRDLMVPRLIQLLKDVIAAAREGETPEGNSHFFAVYLLTEFKAQEAFPVMLEAFSLPDDLPYDLFGDAVTSLPARILILFVGDRVEMIEALVDDGELCDSLRWEAAQSYLHLVRDGRMHRDEAVERLRQHLRLAIDRHDERVAGPLVCELVNYAPKEVLEDMREAYERDLVEPFLVDLDDVERSISEGDARLRDGLKWLPPRDIDTLEELRGWASFQEKPERRPDEKLAPPLSMPRMPLAPPPHFAASRERAPVAETIVSHEPRVGRNDPCPCGSDKKFKKCCGARN